MASNPHIYVSSVHGTNTGGSDTSFASQQTGAMTSIAAASVYDNIGSAIAGASPSNGDIIYVADDHAAAYDNGSPPALNAGTPGGAGIKIISVDASNVDQYSPGASENLTDTADDYIVSSTILIFGVSFETGDNIFDAGAADTQLYLQDLVLTPDGNADIAINMDQDGFYAKLVNVDITPNASNAYIFRIQSAGVLEWLGGSIGATSVSRLFDAAFDAGGGRAKIVGVDLSLFSGTILNSIAAGSEDNILVQFYQCKLNSGVTFFSGTLGIRHRIEFYNCDDGTGNKQHRFHVEDGSGLARNNDSVYVTATESWYDGSDKSSIEVVTTSSCDHGKPFAFELPAQYIDLTAGASDKISIDLCVDSAISLTDTDIAFIIGYADGTDHLVTNWLSSGKNVGAGNYGTDPLAAGTTLTNTGGLAAGDWTGEPASPTFYRVDLDTSSDAGAACVVSVRCEVYKPSIPAGDLFIHPILTLS